jgi:hypothetical protein
MQAGGLVLAAQEWVWLPLSSALSLGLVYAPAVAWITHTGEQHYWLDFTVGFSAGVACSTA